MCSQSRRKQILLTTKRPPLIPLTNVPRRWRDIFSTPLFILSKYVKVTPDSGEVRHLWWICQFILQIVHEQDLKYHICAIFRRCQQRTIQNEWEMGEKKIASYPRSEWLLMGEASGYYSGNREYPRTSSTRSCKWVATRVYSKYNVVLLVVTQLREDLSWLRALSRLFFLNGRKKMCFLARWFFVVVIVTSCHDGRQTKLDTEELCP